MHCMTLEEVTARADIYRLLQLGCRGLDRRDQMVLNSVYHPDAYHRHGDMWEGAAREYAQNVAAMPQPSEGISGQHHITNVIIDLFGSSANVESYFLSMHNERAEAGGALQFVTLGGRFLDRFEKRANRWGIASRHVIMDWSWVSGSGNTWPLFNRFAHGAETARDPSAALVHPGSAS
jgi:hypothetical protein